ncbi:flavin reductase family protein [Arenicella xantha]|uniref:Flavin reductase (DIM6/NTAB) family NADH-FMN oxidoreductase RutF n=1 Tax=Arenicella xantha TaxID=644221 RepID=A0A395JGR5_9GAMM|nr:flavin reductase [Arenicella xantha]RBP48582.1 flavin reductase (DIM6/NTAB) family NADH-FMN oxidoreductase RutF [Arenicella xantha]
MTNTKSYNSYSSEDFANLEKRHRVHFINSLSGYKSANLIGTVNHNGDTNLSIVSSVVHLGADPALVAFINRPHAVERHTLDNILATSAYTINQVSADFFEDAHHTSARYPADVSEFDQTELTPYYTQFIAPYVEQSRIKMGVELREKIDLKINGTILVIGEIVEVLCAENLLQADGKLDLVAAGTVAVSGLDEYHTADSLGRLAYAKPKKT